MAIINNNAASQLLKIILGTFLPLLVTTSNHNLKSILIQLYTKLLSIQIGEDIRAGLVIKNQDLTRLVGFTNINRAIEIIANVKP